MLGGQLMQLRFLKVAHKDEDYVLIMKKIWLVGGLLNFKSDVDNILFIFHEGYNDSIATLKLFWLIIFFYFSMITDIPFCYCTLHVKYLSDIIN